jgi:hypothetical protein
MSGIFRVGEEEEDFYDENDDGANEDAYDAPKKKKLPVRTKATPYTRPSSARKKAAAPQQEEEEEPPRNAKHPPFIKYYPEGAIGKKIKAPKKPKGPKRDLGPNQDKQGNKLIYCRRCDMKTKADDVHIQVGKNGSRMVHGKCGKCSYGVSVKARNDE